MFHQQFLRALMAQAGRTSMPKRPRSGYWQTAQQDLQALVNAPTQTLLGLIVGLTGASFLQGSAAGGFGAHQCAPQTLLAPLTSAANSLTVGGLAYIPQNLSLTSPTSRTTSRWP
jgi:hypothetical protein